PPQVVLLPPQAISQPPAYREAPQMSITLRELPRRQLPRPGAKAVLLNDVGRQVLDVLVGQGGVAAFGRHGNLFRIARLWVSIGIIAMMFVTFLLAQYNMRWIARRAAARRK
ncbi:MAG: hypothetical protein ACHP7A_10250, partial [Caulobacterales bacterium]